MTNLERFNEWYSNNWKRFDYDDALEVWQAAEQQALERAEQTCRAIENEYWDQFKRHPADSPLRGNAYVGGQSDGAGECANAIRALMDAQSGEEKNDAD